MLGLILWKRRLAGNAAAVPLAATGAPLRYSYGADKQLSPTAMLLTGGIVALVGLGLLSMKAVVLDDHRPTVIKGTNIRVTPPPPPPPEPKDQVKEAKTTAQNTVTAPTPPFKPLVETGMTVRPPEPGPFVITPTPGDLVTPGPIDPIKPEPIPPAALPDPVLTKALRDPRYAAAFQPDYPAAMQRQEKEGRVSVKVLVGTDGRVKDVQILSATDPAFAEATERQARKAWRFKPATRDGVPQEEWFTTSVVFKLDQA